MQKIILRANQKLLAIQPSIQIRRSVIVRTNSNDPLITLRNRER